jgi:predicted type IV restriction endonuclease
MNPSEFLLYAKTIDRDKDKLIHAGRRGSEENVKIKIIIPLLQTLGWDLLNDMDFENKGSDIVLL